MTGVLNQKKMDDLNEAMARAKRLKQGSFNFDGNMYDTGATPTKEDEASWWSRLWNSGVAWKPDNQSHWDVVKEAWNNPITQFVGGLTGAAIAKDIIKEPRSLPGYSYAKKIKSAIDPEWDSFFQEMSKKKSLPSKTLGRWWDQVSPMKRKKPSDLPWKKVQKLNLEPDKVPDNYFEANEWPDDDTPEMVAILDEMRKGAEPKYGIQDYAKNYWDTSRAYVNSYFDQGGPDWFDARDVRKKKDKYGPSRHGWYLADIPTTQSISTGDFDELSDPDDGLGDPYNIDDYDDPWDTEKLINDGIMSPVKRPKFDI